jgi:predicted amidohydrolase YtcJ
MRASAALTAFPDRDRLVAMPRTAWIHGNIVTMDETRPRASALVADEGVVEYVGDDEKALERAGAGAEIRDLGGRTVVPGFNDNHIHAVFMGDHSLMPDLSGLDSRSIVELLK